MSVERIVLAVAGLMVMLSVALGMFHSHNWYFLTAFVGLNLFQSAFTGFCPLAKVLKAAGSKPGAAFS